LDDPIREKEAMAESKTKGWQSMAAHSMNLEEVYGKTGQLNSCGLHLRSGSHQTSFGKSSKECLVIGSFLCGGSCLSKK